MAKIRNIQYATMPQILQSLLPGYGVWLTARAGLVKGEDVLLANEDAVVGFAVTAGEAVEVNSGVGHVGWVRMRWNGIG